MTLLYNLLIIIWKIWWPVSATTHTISCLIFFSSLNPTLCLLLSVITYTVFNEYSQTNNMQWLFFFSCLTQARLIKSLFCDRGGVLQCKYTGKWQQLRDKKLSFVFYCHTDCDCCGYQCLFAKVQVLHRHWNSNLSTQKICFWGLWTKMEKKKKF